MSVVHYITRAARGAALLGLVACSASGRAQAPAVARVGLAWTRHPGAETCISQHELQAQLAAHLGDAATVAAPSAASDVRVEGSVTGAATGGWTVQLSLAHPEAAHGAQGSRTIATASPDCRELDRALVLVVALMIQPWTQTGKSPEGQLETTSAPDAEKPPQTTSVTPEAPEADAARPPDPPPDREVRRRDAISLSAGGVVSLGLLPGASFGVMGGAQWLPLPAAGFEVGGVVLPRSRGQGEAGDMIFRAGYAVLRGCGVPHAGRLVLELCLGGWLGRLRAEATRVAADSGQAQARPVGAVEFSLRTAVRLGRGVFARATGGLSVPWPRDRFVFLVDGATEPVHQAAPVTGTVGLEIGWETR